MIADDPVLDRLVRWAEETDAVRALILTSTRAAPDAPVDRLSDHDVVVVVSDTSAFVVDESWMEAYGKPLVCFRDVTTLDGHEVYMRLVLYEDGTKIDYSVWPVELLETVASQSQLPEVLDVGYRVLLDKDGTAASLAPPTYRAFIPQPPTEHEYLALVEEFWWESTYVAKNLWRDELFHLKYNLEVVMKLDLLLRMLEWRVEIDHNWSIRPGSIGRYMKDRLDPVTWAEVEATYVGAGIEENWEALWRTTALFRRIAIEVGERLGYAYPQDLEDGVSSYLKSIQHLAR